MKNLFKSILVSYILLNMAVNPLSVYANTDPPVKGDVTLTTIGAGALSLIVWPGLGQAVNDNKKEKVVTHALIGLFPLYRFWSCYDAVVDRDGGYWNGKI